MPQQCLEISPCFRITIKVGHRAEHARLDSLPTVLEQPHDSTPRQSRKDGEIAWVWRNRPDHRYVCRCFRIRRTSTWNERSNDSRYYIEDYLKGKATSKQGSVTEGNATGGTCSFTAVLSPNTTYPPNKPATNVSALRSFPPLAFL
jgi:hypothetical protein